MLQLDNYRVLRAFGWRGSKTLRAWRQDKGQAACAAAFINAIRIGGEPMPFDERIEVSLVTIALSQSGQAS